MTVIIIDICRDNGVAYATCKYPEVIARDVIPGVFALPLSDDEFDRYRNVECPFKADFRYVLTQSK